MGRRSLFVPQREPSALDLGSLSGDFGMTLGSLLGDFGTTLGSLLITLESLWDHLGPLLELQGIARDCKEFQGIPRRWGDFGVTLG